MALPERDAVRFANALDEYENVCVRDVGGEDLGSGSSFVTSASTSRTRSHLTPTTGTSSGRSSTTGSASR